MLEVSVADQGIGMSEEDAARVFDPSFKTGDPGSKKLNPYGNGLGLQICKQICLQLGGDITV